MTQHDFDFLFGRWNVVHRRLTQRLAGSDEWEQFTGTAETRGLLGGIANVEEHQVPVGRDSGVAFRAFDRARNLWSIYWVSGRDGIMQPPVVGSFDGESGRFEGGDVHDGRPIRVRYLWRKVDRDTAHWEQAFSADHGTIWETNWTMDFTRIGD